MEFTRDISKELVHKEINELINGVRRLVFGIVPQKISFGYALGKLVACLEVTDGENGIAYFLAGYMEDCNKDGYFIKNGSVDLILKGGDND